MDNCSPIEGTQFAYSVMRDLIKLDRAAAERIMTKVMHDEVDGNNAQEGKSAEGAPEVEIKDVDKEELEGTGKAEKKKNKKMGKKKKLEILKEHGDDYWDAVVLSDNSVILEVKPVPGPGAAMITGLCKDIAKLKRDKPTQEKRKNQGGLKQDKESAK